MVEAALKPELLVELGHAAQAFYDGWYERGYERGYMDAIRAVAIQAEMSGPHYGKPIPKNKSLVPVDE